MAERKADEDLTDTGKQMEKQTSELTAVQKELESSLDDTADLRQELGPLQSDYDEKCSEFGDAAERHRVDAELKKQKIESLTMLSEERDVELAATQKQLESERQEILNVRQELSSLATIGHRTSNTSGTNVETSYWDRDPKKQRNGRLICYAYYY